MSHDFTSLYNFNISLFAFVTLQMCSTRGELEMARSILGLEDGKSIIYNIRQLLSDLTDLESTHGWAISHDSYNSKIHHFGRISKMFHLLTNRTLTLNFPLLVCMCMCYSFLAIVREELQRTKEQHAKDSASFDEQVH